MAASNEPGGYSNLLPTYAGTNFKFKDATLGTIFTTLLPYILFIAGISMMFLLIMGGFGVMTSNGDPAKIKLAYGKITTSVIGFLIVFASYLIVQVVEVMLSVNIL